MGEVLEALESSRNLVQRKRSKNSSSHPGLSTAGIGPGYHSRSPSTVILLHHPNQHADSLQFRR